MRLVVVFEILWRTAAAKTRFDKAASKFHFPLRANTSFVPLKASVYDGGANVGAGRLGILRKILKVSAHNGE